MASLPHAPAQGQDTRPTPSHVGPTEDLSLRAAALMRRLDGAGRRVLVEAARPLLLNAPEPYLPASPEDAHIAHWLAQAPLGLLVSEWAGYALVYRLTALGRLVVLGFLTDYLFQVAIGSGTTRRGGR
jgi:hypothetical protein